MGWALKFADDTARLVTYSLLSRLGCDRNAVLTVTLTCNWVAMQHSEQHPRISPSISRPLSMQLRDLPPGGRVGRWGGGGTMGRGPKNDDSNENLPLTVSQIVNLYPRRCCHSQTTSE